MTSSAEIRRVLLIVAMEQEANPFIAAHGLQRIQDNENSLFLPDMPMVCYRGDVNGIDVCLVWTGRDERYKVNNVATTAASVATYASLAALAPVDLVLSAGTAGGFSAVGATVGDVYLSTKCVFHNRRIPSGHNSYEEYGFGHFRSPSLPLLAAACGLKQGVVSTSDSLDHSPIDLELMRGEGAAVKEMEAAAVAWVCQQVHVPFLAIKSITDIVDGPELVDDEFYANLQTASEALQEKLSCILELLSRAPLSHWANGSGGGEAFLPTTPAVVTRSCKKQYPVSRKAAPRRRRKNGNNDSSVLSLLSLLSVAGLGVLIGLAFSKRKG